MDFKFKTGAGKSIEVNDEDDLKLPLGYILEINKDLFISVTQKGSYYRNGFLRLDGSSITESYTTILNQYKGMKGKIYGNGKLSRQPKSTKSA